MTHSKQRMSGILYLVATPIGNLEDITFRAVRILREADTIACEDTRQSRKLLDHYGISRPMVSYHEHNEAARTPELLERLRAGANVALIADAGLPLVSDPGYRLVRAAVEASISVQAIPGASAVLTALAASGLATDQFFFGGFLPAKAGRRDRMLADYRDLAATLIFFEAPHRILETLAAVAVSMARRRVAVARELTKVHEEILRGTAEEIRAVLAARDAVKGEITLLIAKAEPGEHEESTPIVQAVEALIAAGADRMEAIKTVARERGLAKAEVYREMQLRTRL